MSQTTQIISAVCLINMLLKLAEKHTQNQDRLNRDGTLFFFFFLPGVDASHVYVRAWALGCFYSLNYQYPNLSEGADRAGGQLRGDKDCPFSGVTKSGRV